MLDNSEPSATICFPHSTSTVRVRLVDTSGVMVANTKSLLEPVQAGHEFLNIYVAAFLLEHVASGKKVMFDLGIRKDYWNLPAVIQTRMSQLIPALRVDRDTTEILQSSGVQLADICKSIDAFPRSYSMECSAKLTTFDQQPLFGPITTGIISGTRRRSHLAQSSWLGLALNLTRTSSLVSLWSQIPRWSPRCSVSVH